MNDGFQPRGKKSESASEPGSRPSAPSSSGSPRPRQVREEGKPAAEPRPRLHPADQVAAIRGLMAGVQPGLGDEEGGVPLEALQRSRPSGAQGEDPDEGEEARRGAERGEDGRFRAPAEEEPGGEDDAQRPAEGLPERVSVKEAARRLGVTPDELYDALEISTGDGGWTATLGELKAAYAEREGADREVTTRAVALDRREAELTSDMQVFSVLALEGDVPEPKIRRARERINQLAERETRNFLMLAPEFQDDEYRIAWNAKAEAVLNSYGVNARELGVVTSGLRLFFRDRLRDMDRLAKLTGEQPPPKAAKPQGRGGTGARVKQPGPGAPQDEKLAAIGGAIFGRR